MTERELNRQSKLRHSAQQQHTRSSQQRLFRPTPASSNSMTDTDSQHTEHSTEPQDRFSHEPQQEYSPQHELGHEEIEYSDDTNNNEITMNHQQQQQTEVDAKYPSIDAPEHEEDFRRDPTEHFEEHQHGNHVPQEQGQNAERLMFNSSEHNSSWLQRTHEIESTYVSHTHPRLFLLVAAISLSSAVFFTWCWLTFTPYLFPWFIFPVSVALIFAATTTVVGSRKIDAAHKPFGIHACLFVLVNIVLVITNSKTGSFPWSVIPLLSWSPLFVIHLVHDFYPRLFTLLNVHTVLCGFISFMIYIIWCYTSKSFPWFLFPIGAWSVLLFAHFVLSFRRNSSSASESYQHQNETEGHEQFV